MEPLSFQPIPGFVDNYFWLLRRGPHAVVVDPGDAGPVREALAESRLQLSGILITHYHPDHVGGLPALLQEHDVPVFGPRAEAAGIPGLSHELAEGDRLTVPGVGVECQVWEVPGHTLGHIAYVAAEPGPFVLCGDTLFKAGCGRLFEGTPEQMYRSLTRLAALPPETAVYCTHEYTLANLAFAEAVEPANPDVPAEAQRVRALRARGLPSLPSTIHSERMLNPFLRTEQPSIQAAAARHAERKIASPQDAFGVLRRWKDGFRAP